VSQRFGLAGILARRKKTKSHEEPTTEHVERTTEKQQFRSGIFDEKAEEENTLQMSSPQGLVGALQPWFGEDSIDAEGSSSSNRSEKSPEVAKAQEPEPEITRHRPVWDTQDDDDDDSIFDDYHTIMRRDAKKR
jgi:hypothetical protein